MESSAAFEVFPRTRSEGRRGEVENRLTKNKVATSFSGRPPRSIVNNGERIEGIRVTVSNYNANPRAQGHEPMPSAARIYSSKTEKSKRNRSKYELCMCTTLWNQAPALREWIMYHAWLGVEHWFIYDNDSDDGIEEVIKELELQNYNVSRQSWPWIKAQEAGFLHCALKARDECNWVGFFDFDEFFYLPSAFRHPKGNGLPGQDLLKSTLKICKEGGKSGSVGSVAF
ncbi:hypothetical protein CJ030_MR7G016765 [Morella rubra]|uniref:Glycosyltransferase family 92 protein n=1 Tax=Morella rubra TaxID=262757 RepID=A0A6A1UXT4_9ROSI|nr:hypothetical protein CJ030_MR7G016765 [Morella rubra]